jgi:DNA-binding IscR family transcriptional regulator
LFNAVKSLVISSRGSFEVEGVNSRFAVSVHILTVLASRTSGLLTSEFIAGQVNTNPAVVRRLVGGLQKAGLVCSKLGPGGGLSLARVASSISLDSVYCAIKEADAPLLLPEHAKNPNGAFAQGILTSLGAEQALLAALRQTTIADVLADAQAGISRPNLELQNTGHP